MLMSDQGSSVVQSGISLMALENTGEGGLREIMISLVGDIEKAFLNIRVSE